MSHVADDIAIIQDWAPDGYTFEKAPKDRAYVGGIAVDLTPLLVEICIDGTDYKDLTVPEARQLLIDKGYACHLAEFDKWYPGHAPTSP